jgi:hypothetical protein
MASRRIDPRSSRGASVVEYALLISGFAAVLVLGVFTIGRVAGDHIARGGNCLTSKVCTAAPATAAPSASATPTPSASSAAPVATATPTPSSTRSSGSGNNGRSGSGSNGGSNNNGKNDD